MTDSRRGKPASADALDHVETTETVHHEAQAKKRKRPQGVRQLNLTSMLDVTFQLLIFFILTANFAVDEGVLPADLPQGTPPEPPDIAPPPDKPITIRLSAVAFDGCEIWLQQTGVVGNNDFNGLYEELAGKRYDPSANPGGLYKSENPIIIRPGRDVDWNHVVNAFNAVVRARYTNVSFAQVGDVSR